MIILSANNITKEYGADTILKDISFNIEKGDRVGIVGANGAGKTTLLNVLAGEEPATSGNVFFAAETTTGYLKQTNEFDSNETVLEAAENLFSHLAKMEQDMLCLSKQAEEAAAAGREKESHLYIDRYSRMEEEYRRSGGYTYASEIHGILFSMAFSEKMLQQPVQQLSGGEKTRLALACLLLEKPDLLLLDEPTNHLDIDTLKWLEQYVKAYRGTVVIVSHDRYFLDQTVNRILEVEHHNVYKYTGSYSQYAEKKRQRRKEELRRYTAQQKEIRKQEDMIRRFKQRGTEKLAKRAVSRQKQLEKMERMDRPDQGVDSMKIDFHENYESGKDVIIAQELGMQFTDKNRPVELFENVNLNIKRGERICLVGPNGVGKTTLMKIFMGEILPTTGYLKVGYNVDFGYYDQEQENLTESNTVLEELKDSYRLYSDTEMRSVLGKFLFRNDAVFLQVGDLSGGEKARLSLVKLMLSGANVLLLDEPTNHLDIESKEVFEEALADFPGTVIAVSHDRYFLSRVPTKIVEMSSDGCVEYLGQYQYYMKKKADLAEENSVAEATSEKKETSAKERNKEYRKWKKEQEAKERRKRRAREKAEKEIEEAENAIAKLEAELETKEVRTDYQKLEALSNDLDVLNQKLLELYEKWLQ